MSELLWADQRDREVDQQTHRYDQLEDVRETHTRSSHTTNRPARTKKPTISTTINASVTVTSPPLPRLARRDEEPVSASRPAVRDTYGCLRGARSSSQRSIERAYPR